MELADLQAIADKERAARPPVEVRCCTAAGCASAQADKVLGGLRAAIQDAGLGDRVRAVGVGCMRLCSQGPLVAVEPSGDVYQRVTPAATPSVVAGLSGGPVAAERLDPAAAFFAMQASVVLENSGRIEPERIESYIAADGYKALYHASGR